MPNPVLVHRCFDPSDEGYREVAGFGRIFVDFPKLSCGCSFKVSNTERNDRIKNGLAFVVLRPGVTGTHMAQWTEIVEARAIVRDRKIPAGSIVKQFHIENAVDSDPVATAKIEAHGEFFQACLQDLGAEERKRLRISPPIHVMEPKREDGPTLYIRIDQTPQYSKADPGCGHVPDTEYLDCPNCGKKISLGRDMLSYARLGDDWIWRVDCPFCETTIDDGRRIEPGRGAYVLPYRPSGRHFC